VDSQLRVRVTDAALSRDLFPSDYDQHNVGSGGAETEPRPTRWMALESLVDRGASSASDMASTTLMLFILRQIRRECVFLSAKHHKALFN